MTNLEKIRAMSAEELAGFVYGITACCSDEHCSICPMDRNCAYYGSTENIKEWLNSEAKK